MSQEKEEIEKAIESVERARDTLEDIAGEHRITEEVDEFCSRLRTAGYLLKTEDLAEGLSLVHDVIEYVLHVRNPSDYAQSHYLRFVQDVSEEFEARWRYSEKVVDLFMRLGALTMPLGGMDTPADKWYYAQGAILNARDLAKGKEVSPDNHVLVQPYIDMVDFKEAIRYHLSRTDS
jgi:hypothetical protein